MDKPLLIPITVGLLTALFAVQFKGTAGIGSVFGPILLIWFVAIDALGLGETADCGGMGRFDCRECRLSAREFAQVLRGRLRAADDGRVGVPGDDHWRWGRKATFTAYIAKPAMTPADWPVLPQFCR